MATITNRQSKRSEKAKRPPRPVAVHAKSDSGDHIVGIGNIRVVIIPDGHAWFAQGLEIDYAVQGSSIEDAKKRFADGLCATVEEHLRVFGDIKRILKVAPPEVWQLLTQDGAVRNRYTQVTVHDFSKEASALPYSGIEYLVHNKAA